MSPVKMVVGETTEQAADAARAEKKRLKKLAKAKAALLGTTVTNNDPTEDWTMTKKEKKAKAKAAAAAANDSVVSMDDQNNKKKKNKKRKHQDGEDIENSGAVNGEMVPMRRQRTRSETKLDWADEVEQAIPSLLDSAKKKNKSDKKSDGEPAAKKKKKEKKAAVDPSAKVEEEVKEKGAFRKIFYKPTEATLNMPKKDMVEFQEKHKMNLTGRLAEIYKPIQVLHIV